MGIKDKIRKNKNCYFVAKVLKNWRKKEFRDYVTGFGGPDIVQIKHMGDLYPEHLVYCISDVQGVRGNGFFAVLRSVLEYLSYADFYHLTPVVSLRGEWVYREKELINNTDNVFEYYFQPTSQIDYNDVPECCNVVSFYMGQRKLGVFSDGDVYREQRKLLVQYGELYSKYCRLNTTTQVYIDSNLKKTLKGKKTLGVHVRGTDFKQAFNNHPVCISVQDFIEPAKELLKKHGYQQIFLAADSKEAVQVFKNEFGEALVYYEDVPRSDGDIGIHCLDMSRENHHYLLGLEVLRDAYTLAACDSLLAGMSQVSLAARYIGLASGSEHKEVLILDHGINHNKNSTIKWMNKNL